MTRTLAAIVTWIATIGIIWFFASAPLSFFSS